MPNLPLRRCIQPLSSLSSSVLQICFYSSSSSRRHSRGPSSSRGRGKRTEFVIDSSGLGQFVRQGEGESLGNRVGLDVGAEKEPLSDLGKHIKRHILLQGPMSLHEYMVLTTNHSRLGYYHQSSHDQIGTDGDFVTSPEISQIFGEMIAIWCISVWEHLGCPKKVNLVEMGPGKGTLMKDILRTFTSFPRIKSVFNVNLIELSDHMKKLQKENLLQDKSHSANFPVQWHSSLDDIPEDNPILFIGQEVLDTFPIRQYQYTKEGWRELMVDIDPTSDTRNHFRFVLSSEISESMVIFKRSQQLITTEEQLITTEEQLITTEESKKELPDFKEGDRIEYNPLALSVVEKVSNIIKSNQGAALFFDYGERCCQEDTLRGYQRHKETHVLSQPGLVDITADVDFLACENVAKRTGIKVEKSLTQGEFLINMGAVSRLEQLINGENTTDEQAELLVESFKKIVHPDEMGKKFKVLGMSNMGNTTAQTQTQEMESNDKSKNTNTYTNDEAVSVATDAVNVNLPGF